MAFKKKHREAMMKVMDAYNYGGKFKYKKKNVVESFLSFLEELFEDDNQYFYEISLSPSSKSIEVDMPDYTCSYPLKDVYDGGVDYTDFISRYL